MAYVKKFTQIPERPLDLNQDISGGTVRINATGEKFAMNIQIPRDCTLREVGFLLNAVTTGGTLNGEIQTYDPTTGEPDGTSLTTFSATISTASYYTVNLASDLAVTQGDMISIVLLDSGLDFNVRTIADYGGNTTGFPHASADTGSGYFRQTEGCVGHLRSTVTNDYLDIIGLTPIDDYGRQTFKSNDSYPMQGNKITIPMKCKIKGIWANYDHGAKQHVIKLYDSDGATELYSSGTLDRIGDHVSTLTHYLYFDSDIEVEAGDEFYVAIAASESTTPRIALTYVTAPYSQLRPFIPDGEYAQYSYCNSLSPSSTTNWTTTSDTMCHIGLIVSEIDDGTGGGGGGEIAYGYAG